MAGFFITVEGGDGAGKTTHIKYIHSWLVEKNLNVILTREPGGTETGERIREVLLFEKENICDEAELLLMFAARMQNITQVIRPALQQGDCVLCDRFTDASYAYQGGGRGIETARIAQIEQWVQRGFQPDLTFVLDVPVEIGIKRTEFRGDTSDRFERESLEFKQAVRQTYMDRAKQHPRRIKIIDAARNIELVEQDLARELDLFYGGWKQDHPTPEHKTQ